MFRNSTFAIVCFALISAAMVTLWAGAMSGGPASYVLLGGCVFGGMAVVYGLDLLDAVVWRARRLGAGVFVRQQADGAILTICQYTPLAIGAYSVFIAGILTVVAWDGGVCRVADTPAARSAVGVGGRGRLARASGVRVVSLPTAGGRERPDHRRGDADRLDPAGAEP